MTKFSRGSSSVRSAAFTLIEFAIVMVISGLIMAGISEAYRIYSSGKALNDTYDKIARIDSDISNFYSTTGRYPCPADPSLAENDPQYGMEGNCAALTAAATGTCIGAICKVAGARDTLADVDAVVDPVYIGGIPWKSLKLGRNTLNSGTSVKSCLTLGADPTLPASQAFCDADSDGVMDAGVYIANSVANFNDADMRTPLDPYGYQFTYAVTQAMTQKAIFNSAYGAIKVQTELGRSLTNPVGAAHYVIVAPGANHMGAYNSNKMAVAKITVPCVPGTLDADNCDGDSTFTEGILATGNTPASYFDDIVKHSDYSITKLWDFGTGTNASDVHNLNIGNVGVGTNTPAAKLEVANSDLVDLTKGSVKATNVRQAQICDKDGLNCWDPDNFASAAGSTCSQTGVPAGSVRVMTGIRSAQVYCPTGAVITLPKPSPTQACPSGQFAKGFDAVGNIFCGVP